MKSRSSKRRPAVSSLALGWLLACAALACPAKAAGRWPDIAGGLHGGFVSTDRRYARTDVPADRENRAWSRTGWKGERLNGEILLWTKTGAKAVACSASGLSDGSGHAIPSSNVVTHFVAYVKSDDGGKGCGDNRVRPARDIADILDTALRVDIPPRTCQPLWAAVDVPAETAPGTYRGQITISPAGERPLTFQLAIEVLDITLPPAAAWTYYHDQWQNPWAVARYYDVPAWSAAHWELLRPLLLEARQGGQKVITTTLNRDPWGGTTYDPFGGMIIWTKLADGSWSYDYTIFDEYVRFCLGLGIDKYINCYSMIPWNNVVHYFDASANREVSTSLAPGTSQYEAHWHPFLVDFRSHLQARGWLGMTNVAMDERSLSDLRAVIGLVKRAAPGLGIALAGGWYPEVAADIRDYSITFGVIPRDIAAVAAARKRAGQNTTFYVCCADRHPNSFVFSPPAESVWLGWYAAKLGVDGTLRWAFNSWVVNPLSDARYKAYQSGDCFMVYPGRSSIRWERLKEGIQDNEKIRYLRTRLSPELLAPLESSLLMFDKGQDYARAVNSGRQRLDGIVRSWLAKRPAQERLP